MTVYKCVPVYMCVCMLGLVCVSLLVGSEGVRLTKKKSFRRAYMYVYLQIWAEEISQEQSLIELKFSAAGLDKKVQPDMYMYNVVCLRLIHVLHSPGLPGKE